MSVPSPGDGRKSEQFTAILAATIQASSPNTPRKVVFEKAVETWEIWNDSRQT